MAVYSYNALEEGGKSLQGVITASDERAARDKLRAQGLMIVSLNPAEKIQKRKKGISEEDIATFTAQLAQILKAGLPLYECLQALEEQYRGEKIHSVIIGLCEAIKGGASLSEALQGYSNTFDKLYYSMVKAGESAGVLDTTLERLGDLLNKRLKMKKQMITTMIYPCILGAFSLIVIFSLVTFVIPSLESLFADRPLNSLTSFVLGASYILRTYWWLYLPTIASTIFFLRRQCQKEAFQRKRDAWLLQIPVIKTLIIQSALARLTRTMATLLSGGVTLVESIKISRHVMMNSTLEDIIKNAERKIMEGSSLSKELKKTPYVPKLTIRMIATGEESGNLTGMLSNIADIYEGEVEKTLTRLTALAQPIILITMGTIIGFVVLAVLLPLTDISSISMGM